MRELSPRGKLVRDAAIYTPLFLVALVLTILFIVNNGSGGIIGIVLLGGMAFLFGYQSVQSLRDLRRQPQTITGAITRRWTKRDAFVSKSYYITVERAIFRIPVQVYLDLLVKDVVTIVAYPHTGTVLTVERISRPEPELQPASTESQGRGRMLRTARLSASPRSRDTSKRPDAPPQRGARGDSEPDA